MRLFGSPEAKKAPPPHWDNDHDRIRAWLDPTDFSGESSEFKRHLALQAPGTGLWLKETPQFKQWISSTGASCLQINGPTGVGKSVLAASVVQQLSQPSEDGRHRVPVLFFFYKYSRHRPERPFGEYELSVRIVKDWLAQLLPHSVALQEALLGVVNRSPPSVDKLWDYFRIGLASVQHLYFVVDGMYHTEPAFAANLLSRLDKSVRSSPGVVRILTTNSFSENETMRPATTSLLQIDLDEARVQPDIEAFIANRVEAIGLTSAGANELIQAISSRFRGVFLYSRLLLDMVLSDLQAGRRVQIDNLPADLRTLFNRILTRSAEELGIDAHVQVSLLACLTSTLRPLSIQELESFLGFAVKTVPEAAAGAISRQACGSFVEVLADNTVDLAHHSFYEFLLDEGRETKAHKKVVDDTDVVNEDCQATDPSDIGTQGLVHPDHIRKTAIAEFPVLKPGASHRQLALACLNVNLRVLQENALDATARYPFFEYSKEQWLRHVVHDKNIDDDVLFETLEAFRKLFKSMDFDPIRKRRPQSAADLINSFWPTEHESPLHLAAYTGLVNYARRYLPEWRNARREASASMFSFSAVPKPSILESALHHAVWNGHLDTMLVLWPHDDSSFQWAPGVQSDLFFSALSIHPKILEALLRLGLTPDTIPDFKRSVRDRSRNLRVADCIVQVLADLDAELASHLMGEYAYEGLPEPMAVFLRSEQYGTSEIIRKNNPLARVCGAVAKSAGHVECLRLLLPVYPEIDARSSQGKQTSGVGANDHAEAKAALNLLAGSWEDSHHIFSAQMFDILIAAGADVEATDACGNTPILCLFTTDSVEDWHGYFGLSHVGRGETREVMRALRHFLRAGADVSVPGKHGGGILHQALYRNLNIEMLELLVEYGADIHAVKTTSPANNGNGSKKTPLLAAYWASQETPSTTSGILYNIVNSLSEVTAFLISRGARIGDAGDPIHVIETALQSCDAESFRMLLATDTEQTCFDPCLFTISTALKGAQHKENVFVRDQDKTIRDPLPFIRALVDAGANLEARRQPDGVTPLLFSLRFPPHIFEAFVAAGSDLFAQDHRGRGALFLLMPPADDWNWPGPDLDRMSNLIQIRGLDPGARDELGNSLAHVAVGVGSKHGVDPNVPFHIESLLEYLVNYNVSLGAQNYAGQTPLHALFDYRTGIHYDQAGALDHIAKVLGFFSRTGEVIDVNAANNDGLTPLHFAAIGTGSFSPSIIHLLLSHGADLRKKARSSRNALHLACRARNSAAVGYLIDQAPDLVHQVDGDGRTPLFDACISGLVESVGALLRAGARLDAVDVHGRTPLDACAEFLQEREHWVASLSRWLQGKFSACDVYRPSMPPGALPVLKENCFGQRETMFRDMFRETRSDLLQNEGMAIRSVVRALLDAGVESTRTSRPGDNDNAVSDRSGNSIDSHFSALLQGHYSNQHLGDSYFDSTGRARLSKEVEALTTTDDILRDPRRHISNLSPDDVRQLVEKDANLVGCLVVDEKKTSASHRYLHGVSFVEYAAANGMTEMVMALGDTVHYGTEGAGTPLDRWTSEALLPDANKEITVARYAVNRPSTFPQPEHVKTLGDLIQHTQWLWEPLLQVACRRTAPNMEMVRTLVERCGVDLRRPSLEVYATEDKPVLPYNILLHTMAKEQAFWHLEALRYLLERGADVDSRDQRHQTPLLVAVSNPGVFTHRFVELLLEFGADPNYKVYYLTDTCVSLATGKSLDILQAHSAVKDRPPEPSQIDRPQVSVVSLFGR
ncbi:Putative NACHT nucleoside triphosphatase, P-loop containing nucleoside triphosphate hydrolase [Colletotrichum destructivum]|uniref:NACHT nucleoside triphosphatase, P-loop containing nucleoside triphosphate hydrolase n=1 Tax=Colletotrichum destructivum TaxID=34406 RepID=A0AAX4I7A6_9PEZI|nr:Putative NACHT nucleoside triphosphatase, P-loop containing nucleoside triphosphate hydrolase [Colletotrichum destructivum]